jgi:hypothetical protein
MAVASLVVCILVLAFLVVCVLALAFLVVIPEGDLLSLLVVNEP